MLLSWSVYIHGDGHLSYVAAVFLLIMISYGAGYMSIAYRYITPRHHYYVSTEEIVRILPRLYKTNGVAELVIGTPMLWRVSHVWEKDHIEGKLYSQLVDADEPIDYRVESRFRKFMIWSGFQADVGIVIESKDEMIVTRYHFSTLSP